MDLATISMDQDKAQQAFMEYREAVRKRHDAEDEAIMRGYRAMAQGHQLLNLRDAIRAGGVDAEGCPRLAVANAVARWCYLRSDWNSRVVFSPDANPTERRQRASGVYRFDMEGVAGYQRSWKYRAMVPPVPPTLRPTRPLSGYAILWEATWEVVPRPPGDPALLKRITGDLYAVLAIWDLTELERAVLGARATEA